MNKLKDSGIPWIGRIPEHWEVNRAKGMFNHEQRPVRDCDGVITCFRDGEVTLRINRRTEGFTESIQEFGYQGIRKGDLVIHQMDAFAGSIGISDSDGKGSPILICLTPNGDYNNQYYCSLLRVMASQGWIKALYKGIRERSTDFRYDTFSQQYLPVPPLEEQERIAEWLDGKCGEIDELIEVEQQMIADLEAYRQAVITEAVIHGLNPDAPTKPTSIPWLPQIPQHWNFIKLSRICYKITDFVASGSFADLAANVEYLDEPDYAMLIRTTDVSGKANNSKSVYINAHSYNFLSNSNLRGGEIMFPNIGASVGDVYIIPKLYERMTLGPNSIIMLSNECDKFIYYYFRSIPGRLSLLNIAQSTAQPKFNKTDFRNLSIPLPPLSEQQKIAEYLDVKCTEIDELIKVKQEKIEALKEYRQSLIFEAVTGKTTID